MALDPHDRRRLAVELCGPPFNTPPALLSGCVGFGEEYKRVEGFSNREAGAVCLKGTTLKPRLGNAPPGYGRRREDGSFNEAAA